MSVESKKQPNPNQDYIQDKNLDYLLDAIEHETIPEIEINPHCCDHLPNRRSLMHSEDHDGFRFSVYECEDCGKELDFIDKIEELR